MVSIDPTGKNLKIEFLEKVGENLDSVVLSLQEKLIRRR